MCTYFSYVDAEGMEKFLEGFIVELPDTDTSAKLLELTFNSAKRYGFESIITYPICTLTQSHLFLFDKERYLNGIPEEVLRRLVKLKRESKVF